jgi:hypothetical protein
MEGGLRNKAIVRMECATHFAVWEASQYKFMQEVSLEWLNDGPILGNLWVNSKLAMVVWVSTDGKAGIKGRPN